MHLDDFCLHDLGEKTEREATTDRVYSISQTSVGDKTSDIVDVVFLVLVFSTNLEDKCLRC